MPDHHLMEHAALGLLKISNFEYFNYVFVDIHLCTKMADFPKASLIICM